MSLISRCSFRTSASFSGSRADRNKHLLRFVIFELLVFEKNLIFIVVLFIVFVEKVVFVKVLIFLIQLKIFFIVAVVVMLRSVLTRQRDRQDAAIGLQ